MCFYSQNFKNDKIESHVAAVSRGEWGEWLNVNPCWGFSGKASGRSINSTCLEKNHEFKILFVGMKNVTNKI